MRISVRIALAATLCVLPPTPGSGQEAALPGAVPLTLNGDPAVQMVDAIRGYLLEATAVAKQREVRPIEVRRERLRTILGMVDARRPVNELEMEATTRMTAEIARTGGYRVYAVRWPVFDGVHGEGLLLDPVRPPRARIVAIPDADQTPEMLAGLAPGVDAAAQFARRLAESGCQVLVPVLIDRGDTWSAIPGEGRPTNEPHREWIYRMAFEAGRHIIGYEVEKVLAGIDWFAHENAAHASPVGVAGYGEGGLVALYAASLDTRIRAALVSGYFQPRQEVWTQPVYRDVWGLLPEFGDAELGGMVAPRKLIVEASRFPEVSGAPKAEAGRAATAASGAIHTPELAAVKAEAARAGAEVVGDGQGTAAMVRALGVEAGAPATSQPRDLRAGFDPSVRLHRQFDELVAHTQAVIRASPQRRAAFWKAADASSAEKWQKSTAPMRDYIWNEVIGRMPDPSVPANPRARQVFDQPKYRGYEVMLDVWPGIFAYGILLVPKDIRAGERRPVVVCQHGLEGRPREVSDPTVESHYYHRLGVRLAEEGFITFAPQNPYIGQDHFRQIQRMGHPLKLSLFSFILGQHQRILEWLAGLPFVDRERIGFYGLSYGGKTAVRVPPLLGGYALSICSADFNEWVWKNTNIDTSYSYLLTPEYDMLEFNFANVVNYSDLANLMAPRPFMVERGHNDGVSADEWVAFEYAKVARFYAGLGIPERTRIEFFDGPHEIHGVGTFEFLRKFLKQPK